MICNWIFIVQSSTNIFEVEWISFFRASKIKRKRTNNLERHLLLTVNLGLFPLIKDTTRQQLKEKQFVIKDSECVNFTSLESLFSLSIDNRLSNASSKQMRSKVEQNRNNDYLKLMNQANLIKGPVFLCDTNYFELMNFLNLLTVISTASALSTLQMK